MTFDTPSQAMWALPSCATESSPYSPSTRSYSLAARLFVPPSLRANSSTSSRRRLFAVRE